MKVLLLLVVLTEMSTASASWSKQALGTFGNVWQKTGQENNVCGQFTQCRCCLMLQRVHGMNASLSKKLEDLEKQYLQVTEIYNSLMEKRAAFSAALFEEADDLRCLPKVTSPTNVVYKKELINMGDDYDYTSGIYRAPYDGYYVISVTVFHDAGQQLPNSFDLTCMTLRLNGEVIAGSEENSKRDQEDSSTMTAATRLVKGDEVAVVHGGGCSLCARDDHYNVFSVFLLRPN